MTATKGLGTYGNAVGIVTPTDHKMALSGLLTKTGGNAIRAGLFWGGNLNIVTGKANMSYDVAAFTGALSRGASSGTTLGANDGTVNVATTAAPGSNSRIDIIYWWQREYALDGTDSNPVIGVVQGTAAAIPTAPSLAAFPGAIELARATVAAGITATTSATITQAAPFTALAGGIVPFRTKAEMDLVLSLPKGTRGVVLSDLVEYQFSGTVWVPMRATSRLIVARQAFSVVNAVTVDTIFDTTLSDIYRVTLDVSASNAATGLSLVFRNGSTDYVTADQTSRAFELNSTATPAYSASATAAQIAVGRANGAGGGVTEFTIFSPNAAQYTRVQGQVHDGALSRMFWGHVPNVTAFTGFKIKADASRTITGVVTVEAVLKGN